MTPERHPAAGGGARPEATRRAVDELIRRSGARPVVSIDGLGRFQANVWDSDKELGEFLANVRISRARQE